jgi:energy-coupling factor transporter ATP-binding protein EcfA2
MKIIYITGETAQGKTTLANKLGQLLKAVVISTDKAYNFMHAIEKSEASKVYLNTIHHNGIKEGFYKSLKFAFEDEKIIIFEGASLASKKERIFLEKIFNPTKTKLFLLQSEKWNERSLKKHGQPPSDWYKNWFNSISNLSNAITVKDLKCIAKNL